MEFRPLGLYNKCLNGNFPILNMTSHCYMVKVIYLQASMDTCIFPHPNLNLHLQILLTVSFIWKQWFDYVCFNNLKQGFGSLSLCDHTVCISNSVRLEHFELWLGLWSGTEAWPYSAPWHLSLRDLVVLCSGSTGGEQAWDFIAQYAVILTILVPLLRNFRQTFPHQCWNPTQIPCCSFLEYYFCSLLGEEEVILDGVGDFGQFTMFNGEHCPSFTIHWTS
jgi:hypothetical protein